MKIILFIVLFIFLLVIYSLFVNKEHFKKKKKIKRKRKRNYTITGKKDGFGAQYQAIMSGIAFANKKKYNYVHTPLKRVSHGEDKDKLNKFIGIPEGKKTRIHIRKRYANIVHSSKRPSKYYTPSVINTIRKYYYSTPKPQIADTNYIAIHIRRGDVNNKKHKKRYTPNNKYIKIVKLMKKKYPDKQIKIFSEGSEEDFGELGKLCKLELNKDLEYTFHSLVSASVLVTAKSSLSYSAAILNKNDIYYIPFQHKSLKNWNILRV